MMRLSDFGCIDDDDEVFGQAISEAGVVGACAVDRMLEADPAWVKFLHGGNRRFHREVWEAYDGILALGLLLRPDPLGGWGDGIVSETDGTVLCRVRAGRRPAYVVGIGLAAAARGLDEIDAFRRRFPSCDLAVTWSGDRMEVSVPLADAEPGVVVKELHGLRIRLEAPVPPPDSMVQRLRTAGVGVPAALDSLDARLQAVGPWHWSAGVVETDPVREYLMEDEGWLTGAVADHTVVSHSGHGMNSYALTVRLAVGPVALHAQVGYGGLDPLGGTLRATELMHRLGRLVTALGDADCGEEPRCRDVAIRYSDIRGIAELSVWDPRVRRFVTRAVTTETLWDEVERVQEGSR